MIHSFWVPEFLFKRDVFPMPENNDQDNIWQIDQIDREGAFVGRCAELCGTYHSVMNFEVRALNPDLFDRYLQLRAADQPADGAPYTAGEALQALNCGQCARRRRHHLPVQHQPHAALGVRAADRQLSPGGSPDEGRSPDLRAPDDFFFVVGDRLPDPLAGAGRQRRAVPHRRPVADRRHLLPVRRPPAGGTAARGQPGRPRSPTARATSASSRRAATGRSCWPVAAALLGLSLAFIYFWALAISVVILLIVASAAWCSSTTSARPTTDASADGQGPRRYRRGPCPFPAGVAISRSSWARWSCCWSPCSSR